MKFTTRDRDNDKWNGRNCAVDDAGGNAGGWWYNDCSHSYIPQSSVQSLSFSTP